MTHPDQVHAPSYDRAVDLCTATIRVISSRAEALPSDHPTRRAGMAAAFRELADALQLLKVGGPPA